MRVTRWLLAGVVALATLANTVAWAQDTPELTQPVNDFAGVIDAGAKTQLDALIRTVQDLSLIHI